jgi:hypothetical protein
MAHPRGGSYRSFTIEPHPIEAPAISENFLSRARGWGTPSKPGTPSVAPNRQVFCSNSEGMGDSLRQWKEALACKKTRHFEGGGPFAPATTSYA